MLNSLEDFNSLVTKLEQDHARCYGIRGDSPISYPCFIVYFEILSVPDRKPLEFHYDYIYPAYFGNEDPHKENPHSFEATIVYLDYAEKKQNFITHAEIRRFGAKHSAIREIYRSMENIKISIYNRFIESNGINGV